MKTWTKYLPTKHNKYQTALEDIKEPGHEVKKELARRKKRHVSR